MFGRCFPLCAALVLRWETRRPVRTIPKAPAVASPRQSRHRQALRRFNKRSFLGGQRKQPDGLAGFTTIAERRRRVGRTRSAIQPARIRSHEDRVGDRCRERFTIRSWRLSRRDSAMRERTPPAGLPVPFALQRHERVEGRTRWFRSVPSPSPPRTRIQNLKAVLPVWAQALRFGIAV